MMDIRQPNKTIETLTAERDAAIAEREKFRAISIDAITDSEQVRTEHAAMALEFGEQLTAVETERDQLRARVAGLLSVLKNLESAYCEVGPNMSKAQRHSGRLALMAARSLLIGSLND